MTLMCPLCNSKGIPTLIPFGRTKYPCGTFEFWGRKKLEQSRNCYRIQNKITSQPMKFQIKSLFFDTIETFTELDPPIWLSSEDSFPGSTMDNRWFWKEHVLTLSVGESIDTDFNTITRLE